MWQHYYRPTNLNEALHLLAEQPSARIVAGATDLTIELRRGVRPTDTLVDLTALTELRFVMLDQATIRIGALATHNDIIGSPYALQMLPLAQASRVVGAPQIRAVATIAGNLVTASPANDTITALIALDAEIELISVHGARTLPLRDFYQGVRRTALLPGELLREIRVPALRENQRGLFLKLGLRRAQAISVVNVALVLNGSEQDGHFRVADARIAVGCVAPTVIRCTAAEEFLQGALLEPKTGSEAGRLAAEAARPIDDIRGSADYRRHALAALVAQGLQQIATNTQAAGWEAQQVLLEVAPPARPNAVPTGEPSTPITSIQATINGRLQTLTNAHTHTLLDALRDVAGLTGTKEGCAEGECGACTVWLNRRAVMSCLIPAAQADGGIITTIEGLAQGQQLHPVQQAFIEHGAVQCGFCTPGFLMAAAQLLQEHPHPTIAQIETAISGNLCRCTGYKQIIQAISAASSE
jgi:carbon-monoxide dehydrogenase medium subunit